MCHARCCAGVIHKRSCYESPIVKLEIVLGTAQIAHDAMLYFFNILNQRVVSMARLTTCETHRFSRIRHHSQMFATMDVEIQL